MDMKSGLIRGVSFGKRESLNSDGKQFHPNINKTNNHLSCQTIEHKKDHDI
jgi:hypothetical protein